MAAKDFFRRFSIGHFMDAMREAFVRFPLPVCASAALTLLCFAKTHRLEALSNDFFERSCLFLVLLIVFATIANLFAEGRGLARKHLVLLTVSGAMILALAAYLPAHFSALHLYLGASVVLSLLFAPYILRPATEDSVWYYNFLQAITWLTAGVSALILGLGSCAILASVEYLFEIDVPGRLFADIWIVSWLFFFPVFLLANLPRQFDYQKTDCVAPTSIYFIANYLLVPLVLVYMGVLYAYFIKIVLQWDLPRGNLAYMITGFGVAGIATHIISFAMRQTGTVLLQQFYQHFYKILVVPVLLLAIGIYTRISAYGVTEQRYAIVLATIWLAWLSGSYILRPQKAHVKHAPMVLVVLGLLASFGPWNAVAVSSWSQTARLEKLLLRAGVLGPETMVKKTSQKVSFQDRREISAIVAYLHDSQKLHAIDRWIVPFQAEIEKDLDDKSCHSGFTPGCWGDQHETRIVSAWGMKYVDAWRGRQAQEDGLEPFTFKGEERQYGDSLVHVASFDYVMNVNAYVSKKTWKDVEVYKVGGEEVLQVTVTLTPQGLMRIALKDGRQMRLDLRPRIQSLLTLKTEDVPKEKSALMVLNTADGGLRGQLRVTQVSGRHSDDGEIVIRNLNATLLLVTDYAP